MKPQLACGGVTGIECPRPLRGVTGKYALRADRLLFCGKLPPNTTTEDLADILASSLEEACGGDEQLWERLKPNRGTPLRLCEGEDLPRLARAVAFMSQWRDRVGLASNKYFDSASLGGAFFGFGRARRRVLCFVRNKLGAGPPRGILPQLPASSL